MLLYSLRPCLVAYGCLFPFSPHELRGMLLQMQIFGAVDVSSSDPAAWKTALNNAFDDFTRWRKRHWVSCSQKRFKFRMLVRNEYGFCLNAKGYNARVIAEWLLFKLCDIQSNPVVGMVPDDRADLCEIAMKPGGCLWSICLFLGLGKLFIANRLVDFKKHWPIDIIWASWVEASQNHKCPITTWGEEYAVISDWPSAPSGSCFSAWSQPCAQDAVDWELNRTSQPVK